MGHCTWPQLVDEWSRSRSIAQRDHRRTTSRDASVPGGDFAPQVAEAAARAGITQAVHIRADRATSRQAFGLTLAGRFTIQRWTSRRHAAALAAGDWLPCARQAVVWNAKKMTKRLGGERYLQIRRLLLGHGERCAVGGYDSVGLMAEG